MTDAGEMSLGLESLKGFTGKIVQAAFGFVGTIVFARVLGPTSFGGFYLLLTVVFFANRPVAGVAQAAKKRWSEAGSNHSEIMGASLIFGAVLLLIVSLIAFSLQRALVEFTQVSQAVVVLVVLFVSFGAFSPLNSMLSADGELGLQVWTDTFRSVLTLPLQLGFVVLGFGAAGMGYGLASATLISVVPLLWILGVRPSVPSMETARSLWKFARHSIPLAFVNKVYNRIDIVLIGVFVTAGAAGQYEAALKLTVPASFVPVVVTSGLMAKVSSLHSQNREFATDVSNAASFVSILAVPLFFGAFAISESVIVTAYGGEYERGAPLLVGLAAYQIISTQTSVVGQTLNALDQPDRVLRVDVITLLINVVLGVALVQSYGAFGVVVATVVAGGVRYGLLYIILDRLASDVNLLPWELVEQVFAGVVMFGVVELLSGPIRIQDWFDLGILLVTGALVYGLVLILISKSIRFTIKSIYTDVVS